METRIPEEWRVPLAYVVLLIVPTLVAGVRFVSTPGRVGLVGVALSLLIVLAGAYALLQRSRIAWWLLVVWEGLAVAGWVYHVGKHGLGLEWTLGGVLTLVGFALLVSAPMRRFVRLRGRLAAGPH